MGAMRQGQQSRRGRGRNSGNSGNSGNSNRKQSSLSRSYESNGPDVKIRGTAAQIAEKYSGLARDASSAGDRIMAENYSQHAEHYNRIIMLAQPQPSANASAQDEQPSGPQRSSVETNGAGNQPQPLIPASPSGETKADGEGRPASQSRETDGRRRRRRYPTNGSDRTQTENKPADSASDASVSQTDALSANVAASNAEVPSSDQPSDEAVAH